MWLRAIESDLRPLNIGSSYAWKMAGSKEHWRSIVDMAMLKKSIPWREIILMVRVIDSRIIM